MNDKAGERDGDEGEGEMEATHGGDEDASLWQPDWQMRHRLLCLLSAGKRGGA